ncbi:alpha/beta hydrolase [Effusibacillus dendaii]|uniref:Alpha/beta hydrolase n=2 Tax=Effusibacillus dendaii TaxID=2743772 RepID=A0A7I8D9L6_9BACL|nr:alpha/beta hydrolase [Effusibacillus dendaii]
MIILHGISEDSKYLKPLAEFISANNLANVYTPDLRGYGENPVRRGDVDYIGQIEDDIADLIEWIATSHCPAKIILAGHSAGGGTAIRFAGSKYVKLVQAYLLLAPLLGPGAPTERPSDGTLQINKKRLITLFLLNGIGIKKWNYLPVMKNNKPEELRHGSETLEFSFRLLISRTPMKYKRDLQKLNKPTLVLAGSNDEVFASDQYEPVFSEYTKAKVAIVPNESHDGILSNAEIHQLVKDWIANLDL